MGEDAETPGCSVSWTVSQASEGVCLLEHARPSWAPFFCEFIGMVAMSCPHSQPEDDHEPKSLVFIPWCLCMNKSLHQ